MLVLSRKKNQSIVICDNIVIEVLEVRGNRVRLGIDAPQGIPIHRAELGWVELAPAESSGLLTSTDCLLG